MSTPRESTKMKITARAAKRRPSSNPAAFMAQYAWWTAKADKGDIDDLTVPLDPVDQAAQIEGYAAARRRDAYSHPADHHCDACKVQREWQYQVYGNAA